MFPSLINIYLHHKVVIYHYMFVNLAVLNVYLEGDKIINVSLKIYNQIQTYQHYLILINYVSFDPTLSNSVKTFPQYPQFCLTLINPIHFVSLSYNLFTSIWFYWILSDSTWSLYFTKINFSCLYLIFLSSLLLFLTLLASFY